MSVKVFEAREHCKAAERAMKTTMFRWKADYDSAADEFSQAAQCYRIARDLPNSKDCHIKASECYKKNNAFFHAAKALENAMIVCKEFAPPEEIYKLALDSGSLYQQHGSGDSGASVLDKAAKILEENSPELAVKLFQQAADVSSDGDDEPTATQLAFLMSEVVTYPRIDHLSLEEVNEWNVLTQKLNNMWGAKKTAGEWIEIWFGIKEMQLRHEALSQPPVMTDSDSDTEDTKAPESSEVIEAPKSEVTSDDMKATDVMEAMNVMEAPDVTEAMNVMEALDVTEAQKAKEAVDVRKSSEKTETESSQHQGSEYISKASRILVKLQRYDEAVDSLRREIGFHQESGNIGAIGRLTVAIVLVQLARGDTVAAEKAYKEWGSNCEVAEMQTLEQILQAYDEEDRESAKRALASPFIRNMDVEYARLAASVPLPEAMEPAPRAAVRENAAPSYVSPNAQSTTTAEVSHEEIEESPYAPVTYAKKSDDEDGLC